MSDLDGIIDLFREEATEHLAALEKGFLDLEAAASADQRESIIDRLFRHAHGLKGAARAVELLDIQQTAQLLEDTLDELRENPETVTTDDIEQGLAQFDELRNAFDQWQGVETPSATTETLEPQEIASAPEDVFTVRVSSSRLDRMLSEAGELRISQRSADLHARQLATLGEHLRESPIADLLLPTATSQQVTSAIGHWQSAMLDELKRIQNALHNKRVREELLLESLEDDIQEARLLSLSILAESMRRPVRDLAQSLGKSIRYEIDVGTVLLDKAVIEALKDPLLHMIRNAAHHGIEEPQTRRAAGKPEEGRLLLQAKRRGDRVHIEVRDDGHGVDFERIRERVLQMDQLDESEVAELEDQELAAFLFRAGFTTAAEADEISGRGVGLDAVHDAVRRLHGNVGLKSTSPAGTTFLIDVPVTISTLRILTVTSGGQCFGIPSSSIVRTSLVEPGDLRQLEGCLILTVDGEPVPWVTLADLVGSPVEDASDPDHAIPYVLTSLEGRRLAVGVDDAEDEREVILKPLGFPLNGMSGIVGGTVRPDGSVQIVLDLASAAFQRERARRSLAGRSSKRAARILVVDDSPTTRNIIRNVLAAAGYSVRTAANGVDALERLRYQPVDLVVTDVQMPRMNGCELTREIKSQFRLPVILVTGMEKEEQRREGLAAGADAYIVKSTFEGAGLLEVIKQFV